MLNAMKVDRPYFIARTIDDFNLAAKIIKGNKNVAAVFCGEWEIHV